VVVRKKKRISRFRGSRTHGYGRVGQHRKKGQQGGSGMTGLKKHKWIWTVKYGKDYFGKHGFVPKTSTINKVINLGEVSELAAKHSLTEINVKDFGYDKVLGKGKLTQPLIIKATLFSKQALAKIEEVGGKAISPE